MKIQEQKCTRPTDYTPIRKKYDNTVFLKHMSSAASTHRASFASQIGKPLNAHITGSSKLQLETQ